MNLTLFDISMIIVLVVAIGMLVAFVIALLCELNENKNDNSIYYIFEVEHMYLPIRHKDIVYASCFRDAEKKIRRRFKPSKYVIKSLELVGEC